MTVFLMPLRSYPIKLTDEQVEAVNAAYPDKPDKPFSEKLRGLVAGGLALHQIEWPETPQHGGARTNAGRKTSQ